MRRPNVVVVVADDLGYSDLGCYGGEIRTPHLDALAADGVRLSQFANTARCSPSRASLLTGLHPHQTGIGILTNDDSPDGYPGRLNDRCATMAEVLRDAGYATCLAGKWHLTNDMRNPDDAWPTRRGFERFFGTLTGCGSYYDPGTLTRGEQNVEHEAKDPEFFYTDAITDEAVSFLQDSKQADPDRPVFLYTAYTAPHWPLHAPEGDVAEYAGAYAEGWQVLRRRRLERQRELGILGAEAELSPADSDGLAWEEVADPVWEQRRMEVYAAQVTRMDAGIGRIMATLSEVGELDGTIVVFLSDNGASSEALPQVELERFIQRTDILRTTTRDGRPVRIGNEPGVLPGPEDTYASYGRAWANLSNTPFRYYKQWVHEGGVAAPFIVRWGPGELPVGSISHVPYQLVDVLPTILELTGAAYPSERLGVPVAPLEGRGMMPGLRGESVPEATQFWEHTGNAGCRRGWWKLVRAYPGPWELYDLDTDRSELADLALEYPDIVAELSTAYEEWSRRVGVLSWEQTLQIYAARGLGAVDAAG